MIKFAAPLLAAALLAGAAAVAGPDRHLGATVRSNEVVQLVNPNPEYGDDLTGTSGRRSADALTRYQTGKLKPLLKTNGRTDVGGQGGAGDTPTTATPLVATGQPN